MRRSALLAACLLAAFATAACTSSDGIVPPAEIGAGNQAAVSSDNVMPSSGSLAVAPSPALAPAAPTTTTAPTTASTAPLGSEPAPAFSGTEPSNAVPQGDGGPVAAVISPSRIQFAPITGTTREAAAPLSEQLAARARQHGIGLAGNGALPTHILKGYFSEISEGGSTTVIYVWDVMDPAGNRLHRIQGQTKVDRAGGWAVVPASAMKAIADRTIDELAQWLSTRTG
jgi:hypothetical protein